MPESKYTLSFHIHTRLPIIHTPLLLLNGETELNYSFTN